MQRVQSILVMLFMMNVIGACGVKGKPQPPLKAVDGIRQEEQTSPQTP